MSQTLTKTSKTELVIAIDDEDSDSEKDQIVNSNNDIDDEVSHILNSILDSIETMPLIDKYESDFLQIDDSDQEEAEESNGEQTLLNANKLSKQMNRVIRPVDDIEDIENMEVNIYNTRDDESDFDEFEDLEAEDCMIIDDMTNRQFEQQLVSQENNDSDDDDIEIIDDNEESEGMNTEDNKSEQNVEDIIDLSDDEEDCVIINDSFSLKLNQILESDGSQQLNKRSLSPVYSSDSFIPFSQPSTSSDRSESNQRSLSPVVNFRGFRSADRRSDRIKTSLNTSFKSSYSSPSSSSLVNLFRTPPDHTLTRNVSHTTIQSTYYERNLPSTRVCSTYIPSTSSMTSSASVVTEEEEEDRYLYEDPIPFLYEEVRPSTSSDSIGSSNVRDIDIISESVKLNRNVVQNVLNLIEDQCTIPFIVRYRQSAISGIDAERVRKINTLYNELKKAREKAKDVEQVLKKQERINPRLQTALNRCKNVFEVDHLFKLCRSASEDSEKYRNLGLSDSATAVLEGKRLDPNHFVNRFAFGMDTPEKIEEGWSAIIADIISKDCDVLEFLISATKQYIPTLHVLLDEDVTVKSLRDHTQGQQRPRNADLIQKYSRFKKFVKPVDKINAHSYMAIERGESLGILNVFIEFDSIILNKLIEFCVQKWNRCISYYLVNCVRIAFNNQLKPSLEDYIRFELRHSSHMTALDVFRENVKYLLLEPPLRGEFVIGVDPGHRSGYKVIVVSPWLIPLDSCVLKLDPNNYESSALKLRKLMNTHNCSIIALGNGTGCRRFEDMLLEKIRSGFFGDINLKYKIINESGVSYYSVTEEAKKDCSHFDPQMIGAISIARRLIDPLSELVKVDPKRLQVGMYMRDIEEEAIKKVFHEVAVECVSFCGVDVNVAPFELLSKVAGLEPTTARKIIEKRERDGLFTSRSQLKKIDDMKWKQFEQCAGFIKVMPLTRTADTMIKNKAQAEKDNEFPNKRSATSTDDYDPLDSTIVHPESYSCANTYLELIGASKDEIGKQSIRTKINLCYDKYSLTEIAQLCNTHTSNMKLIVEGLSNSIDFDYRTNFAQIYIPDIQNFEDLSVGMQLKGRVVNVTPMGAFIDCGIKGGINAYLHPKECDRHSIVVNDNLLVVIESIKKIQQRFSVEVIKVFKNSIKFI